MKDIDWTKAPDGTTHAGWLNERLYFYKMIPSGRHDYFFSTDEGKWSGNWGTPQARVLIEKPKEKEMTFQAMKFRVRNSKHSKMIQMKLFELGYKWDFSSGVSHQDQPYLYTTKGGSITFSSKITGVGYFEGVQAEEMVIQPRTTYELVQAPVTVKPETVELNGKTYLKADLEAALAKLQPVK